jgi:hypothetical protein
MIAHQAISMHLPAGLLARLSQRFDKIMAVNIVQENVFAPVPATHDVVTGVGQFHSKFARHRQGLNPDLSSN